MAIHVQEVHTWKSSPTQDFLGKTTELVALRTPMLTAQSLAPLQAYYAAVEKSQEAAFLSALVARQAQEAASALSMERAASSQANTSVAGLVDSVVTEGRDALGYPVIAGALQGSLWPCIENAESGDRPQITSGMYGILVSTWHAYPDYTGGYSYPGAAPLSVQNGFAQHLYDLYGWRPWNNHCTGT